MTEMVAIVLSVFLMLSVLLGTLIYFCVRKQIESFVNASASERVLRIVLLMGCFLALVAPLAFWLSSYDFAHNAPVYLISTLVLSTPLLFAAMGGLTSERSGIINIALEGKMLGAAVVTAIVATRTTSPLLGLAAGIGAGILLSLLHWLMTQTYRIDHIVSGMAINAIALGASNFLDRKYLAGAGSVPIVSLIYFYVAAFLLPIALGLYLSRTRPGLRLLAVGEDPAKSRQMGLSPLKVRFWGLMWTGVFCGLGGALVVFQAAHFVDNITAGRGFIALAALILGGWRPIPAALACLAFGALQALQIQLQGTELMGAKIPTELWLCVPYLATVIALAGFLTKSRAPAALGKA